MTPRSSLVLLVGTVASLLLLPGAPAAAAKKKHVHDARHGGQVGMWKDWHLEVTEETPGAYRVWLTDAYRQPLALAGVSATVEVSVDGQVRTNGRLEADATGESLAGQAEAVDGPHDARFDIAGLPEKVFMEFHFEPAPATQPVEPGDGVAVAPAVDSSIAEDGVPAAASAEPAPPGKKAHKAHQHGSQHGGQLGMAGELHLEVAVAKAGEYRVWPTDAYRKAISTAGLSGTVTVLDGAGQPLVSDLTLAVADDDASCLIARGDPLTGTLDVQVSVVGLQDKPLDMEFFFEVK